MLNLLNWRCWAAFSAAILAPKSLALEPSDLLLFDVGPFSIRPQANLDLQYNDNVYYREENVVGDFITVLSPGVKIQIGQQLPDENRASVQYMLNQLFFLDNTELNATQHRINTELRYDTGRTRITGRDSFEFLSSVIGGAFGLPGRRVDRLVVSDVYQADYRLSAKTGIYARAEHGLTDFEESVGLFDRQRFEGTGGFEWRYTDRTIFFGEIFYGKTFLEDNLRRAELPDTTFVGGFVGVRGNFTERLIGRVKAGYESTTFSDDSPAGDAPAADAALTFLATDRLSLEISYSRRQEVSVQFARSAYTSDLVSFQVSQILGSSGQLRAAAGATYNWIGYEPSVAYTDRDDTFFSLNASLTYYFQTWFITRLAYAFEGFESSLPARTIADYKVNRVTLSLAVGF